MTFLIRDPLISWKVSPVSTQRYWGRPDRRSADSQWQSMLTLFKNNLLSFYRFQTKVIIYNILFFANYLWIKPDITLHYKKKRLIAAILKKWPPKKLVNTLFVQLFVGLPSNIKDCTLAFIHRLINFREKILKKTNGWWQPSWKITAQKTCECDISLTDCLIAYKFKFYIYNYMLFPWMLSMFSSWKTVISSFNSNYTYSW